MLIVMGDVRDVLRSKKLVMNFMNFMSSYGGKLFLHICKLEWFKSKQIWVDENVFIFSQ
jgi:hypothetical protein